jgi:hypothetical protein
MKPKPLPWMIAGSLLSWLAVSVAAWSSVNPELLLGMAGPLVSATVTWILVERTHAASPERVTNVLIVAFGVKLLFFAAYVSVILGALGLRPKTFVVGLTAYYIALHVTEAFILRRLSTEGA